MVFDGGIFVTDTHHLANSELFICGDCPAFIVRLNLEEVLSHKAALPPKSLEAKSTNNTKPVSKDSDGCRGQGVSKGTKGIVVVCHNVILQTCSMLFKIDRVLMNKQIYKSGLMNSFSYIPVKILYFVVIRYV